MSSESPETTQASGDASGLTLREYRAGDETEILATFNRIFAAVDPSFTPRTLAFWRWQFLENPAGSLILLAFTEEGRVAGQLANVLQRVRLEGRAATFSQAVDSMSDPALRRGLKRESLQARLGNAYAETYAGPGEGQHALLWGAPVPAAWRVGKRFIRYEVVRTQLALEATPEAIEPGATKDVELELGDAFPAGELEALFERVAARRGAIGVRDHAWMDWRYRRHPERAYAVALARRGGELVGLAVAGRGSFGSSDECTLLADWLVPLDEEAAAARLIAWLAERATEDGIGRVRAVFPDRAPEWLLFQRAGFRAVPTPYAIVGRECVPGYDMRWMHEHWYYTLGDTDLV